MGLFLYLAACIIVNIVLLWLFMILIFYIAGRIVSGINVTFTDAAIVAFVGAIADTLLRRMFTDYLIPAIPAGPIADLVALIGPLIILLIIYIPLIMHFFDTSLGGAILVGILAIVFSFIFGIIWAIIVVFINVLLLVLLLLPTP